VVIYDLYVFFRETSRIGGKGIEKCFYIVFKKDGKIYEEKVGRQFADDMTPSRAARVSAERIENKRQSRKALYFRGVMEAEDRSSVSSPPPIRASSTAPAATSALVMAISHPTSFAISIS